VVLLRGLVPFHFAAQRSEFSLIPFGGFLNTQWQSGIFVMLEKGFYYGTAIWLLSKAGIRFRMALAIVAAVLLAIEIAQTRLPGRTPEITDPILAILIGFVLAWMSRPVRGQLQTAQLE
jgi:VanZ family protein